MDSIIATFKNPIYVSDDNSYCVFSFTTTDDIPILPINKKLKNPVREFVAKGHFLSPNEKDVKLFGNWVNDKKYGKQFDIVRTERIIPDSLSEIEKQLLNYKYKNLTPKCAKALVKEFGKEIYQVLDTEPEKTKEFFKNNFDEFLVDYKEKNFDREVVSFLNKLELPITYASKIVKKYACKKNAMEKIKENPYILCNIEGISFDKIDEACKLQPGFDEYNELRIMFAVYHILKQNEQNGNLFIEPEKLLKEILKYCNNSDFVRSAINNLIGLKYLTFDGGVIYLNCTYKEEYESAKLISILTKRKPKFDMELVKEKLNKGTLDDVQTESVIKALTNMLSIITGGPGTGKTTTINKIVETMYKINPNANITLCAPTGRAARRISETTNMQSYTIHNILGLRPDSNTAPKRIESDLLICDEMSMCDMSLFYNLISSVSEKTIIVLVGDVDQLPSVGPGEVFSELIACGVIPTTFLEKIYRQEEGNDIIENSKKINKGDCNLIFSEEFKLIPCFNSEQVLEWIRYLISVEYKDKDVQVLTPLRRKTSAGVSNLNPVLQELINENVRNKKENFSKYFINDKVIHLKNEELVSNGDIGVVSKIYSQDNIKYLDVKFDNGNTISYEKEELEKIDLAYALTVHKSQGGEYPIVIIPFVTDFRNMLQKRLLYTAVTRAKEQVIILGNMEAINVALSGKYTERKRNTFLASRILVNQNDANQ